MDIQEIFLKTLEENQMVKPGEKIIIGVSGGPDSVCLLHLFKTFKAQLGISLYAAHLDHMFRGEESEEDARFVKNLCQKWEIPIFTDRANIPEYIKKTGLSPEDAARKVRYAFFKKIMNNIGAQKIATGHNRNDNEETILMNIFRGTGLKGLVGIEPVRECFIRPLIEIPRDCIEKYLKERNIPFRIDSTNLTTDYFRNSLRLELLPLIRQKYCPHIGKSLRRLAEIARRDLSFIEEETEKAFLDVAKSEPRNITIDLKKFAVQHEAIKYRLARRVVERLTGDVKNFEIKHAEILVKFIQSASSGSMIDLPKNLEGIKEYERVIIKKRDFNKKEGRKFSYPLKVPGKVFIPDVGASIKAYIVQRDELTELKADGDTAYLDYDRIGSNLIIRNRRHGDRFKPFGSRGFKKLKDFFIDEKIPRRKRDEILIVESDGKIAWVAGMRIDDEFKVRKDTKRILVLKLDET